MDKNELIRKVNRNGLRNSLISIYYDIGRVFPFRAQRFPDGRISDYYKSQYVEVYEVKPSGKGGKYGNAYGFYYRNGERADDNEIDPEQGWCKKSNATPQCIPCAACGSWVLLDILDDPKAEPALRAFPQLLRRAREAACYARRARTSRGVEGRESRPDRRFARGRGRVRGALRAVGDR